MAILELWEPQTRYHFFPSTAFLRFCLGLCNKRNLGFVVRLRLSLRVIHIGCLWWLVRFSYCSYVNGSIFMSWDLHELSWCNCYAAHWVQITLAYVYRPYDFICWYRQWFLPWLLSILLESLPTINHFRRIWFGTHGYIVGSQNRGYLWMMNGHGRLRFLHSTRLNQLMH